MEKDQWNLSKEEYDKLLAFLGYGNFPEADMIVFGNEEGAGGYSIEANVKARCNSYGKDKDGNYIHRLSPNDWKDGYWDLQENEERPKLEKHLLPHEEIQEQGYVRGAFLPAISRMCLGLEAKNDEVDQWFQSFEANPTAGNQIKDHIRQILFKKHEGIQTALVDWRPLPRNNEKTWYPIEYERVSQTSTQNPYLRAFNNPNTISKNNITFFSDFNKDVEQRAGTIKSLLEATPAKVIIGLGGADGMKKIALEKMFGGIFEPLVIESVDVSYLKMYKARVALEKKDLYIFLLPFPVAGNVFKSQDDVLGLLKEITVKHLAPIIKI